MNQRGERPKLFSDGMSSRPECGIWRGMWARCTNPEAVGYAYYGGRGIGVIDRWRSFAAFYEDMGARPSPAHTLDRYPDNDGDYGPGNCRWATRKQQQRNRRCQKERLATRVPLESVLRDAVGEWAGTKAVAAALGVTQARVRHLCQSGELGRHRLLTGRLLHLVADVEVYRAAFEKEVDPSFQEDQL